MTPQDDLYDDWKALGYVRSKPSKAPVEVPVPRIGPALAWLGALGEGGDPILAVPGQGPQSRGGFYNQIDIAHWTIERSNPRSWIHEDFADNWFHRVSRLQPDQPDEHRTPIAWAWLWELVRVEGLIVEEPIGSMVDKAYSLPHDLMRMLFACRFLAIEDASPLEQAQCFMSFVRWFTGQTSESDERIIREAGVCRYPTSLADRFDLVLLLLDLAEQNGIFAKIVFVFDDLESAGHTSKRQTLKDLYTLIQAVRRAAQTTSNSTGVLLGLDPRRLSLVRKQHPKLAMEISKGLQWTANPSKDGL